MTLTHDMILDKKETEKKDIKSPAEKKEDKKEHVRRVDHSRERRDSARHPRSGHTAHTSGRYKYPPGV